MAGRPSGSADAGGVDRSVRVTVPASLAEQAGAVLMDVLGPFEEQRPSRDGREVPPLPEETVTLIFYPPAGGPSTRDELLPLLPATFAEPRMLEVQTGEVSRDWVEGWRDHFRPIVVGIVRIRPPWEPPLLGVDDGAGQGAPAGAGLVDVVINPGLGFGTGLHPTTRGTLLLLQEGLSRAAARQAAASRGPLVDVGTGSGILAIAAAKLGWAPVVAMDNDPVALVSARENVEANGVRDQVETAEADAEAARESLFQGATILANMTLEPVSLLIRRLARESARPRRLVVSGILAGAQEEQLMLIAYEAGFSAGRRLYEAEWVSIELLPDRSDG